MTCCWNQSIYRRYNPVLEIINRPFVDFLFDRSLNQNRYNLVILTKVLFVFLFSSLYSFYFSFLTLSSLHLYSLVFFLFVSFSPFLYIPLLFFSYISSFFVALFLPLSIYSPPFSIYISPYLTHFHFISLFCLVLLIILFVDCFIVMLTHSLLLNILLWQWLFTPSCSDFLSLLSFCLSIPGYMLACFRVDHISLFFIYI